MINQDLEKCYMKIILYIEDEDSVEDIEGDFCDKIKSNKVFDIMFDKLWVNINPTCKFFSKKWMEVFKSDYESDSNSIFVLTKHNSEYIQL